MAAEAYSYDEIVQMVHAEEKVFGHADYAKSLDQRLAALETSVLGGEKTGSDTVRLNRVCRSLGLIKDEEPRQVAPFSVVVSPTKTVKKSPVDAVNAPAMPPVQKKAALKEARIAAKLARHAQGQKTKVSSKPATRAVAASSNQPAPIAKSKNAIGASASLNRSVQKEEAPASTQQDKQQNGGLGFGAILIGAVVGIVLLCCGMVVFILFRVKNESHHTFVDEYDEMSENEEKYVDQYEEQPEVSHTRSLVSQQQLPLQKTAPHLPTYTQPLNTTFEHEEFAPEVKYCPPVFEAANVAQPPIAPQTAWDDHNATYAGFERIEITHQQKVFAESNQAIAAQQAQIQAQEAAAITDAREPVSYAIELQAAAPQVADSTEPYVAEQAYQIGDSIELPGDTIHVSEFALPTETALSTDPITLTPPIVVTGPTPPHLPPPPAVLHAAEEIITNDADSTHTSGAEADLSSFIASMTVDELTGIIEKFNSNEPVTGDPIDDFRYMYNNADTAPFNRDISAESFANLIDISNLLPEIGAPDNASQVDEIHVDGWPSYESPVSPTLSTVNSWKVKHETENDTESTDSDLESMAHAIEAAAAETRFHESAQDQPVTATFNKTDQEINNLLQKSDSEGSSYRALAQMLIDAAKQARSPSDYQPVRPAMPSRIPVHRKRALASIISGNGSTSKTELESKLRELFSEK